MLCENLNVAKPICSGFSFARTYLVKFYINGATNNEIVNGGLFVSVLK
jgi:hypothetical protein